MKTNDPFSEQVLQKTLSAVRYEKRHKKQQRAGLTICLLAGALTLLHNFNPPHSTEESPQIVGAPEPEKTRMESIFFSTAAQEKSYTTVSTKDRIVQINYITTEELSAMLGDTPYGIYKTKSGKLRFWFSAIAAGN